MDTFTTLWNRLQLRVPAAGPEIAQDLVRDCFNQLVERRPWSWLRKSASFYVPTYTRPGTVSITGGSPIVTGAGTSFTADMVGKQLRIGALGGSSFPTYTILQVLSSTSLVLDAIWVGPNQVTQAYIIFQCYFPVPADFQMFYSVTNPTANYRLNHNATQAELDSYDPQRAQSGIAFAMAFHDYSQNGQGTIGAAVQVKGTGPIPVSTTSSGFYYPQDSIYTIEITTGGAVGASQFRWQQDNGVTQGSAVVTSSSAINLSQGVQVYFPVGNYTSGDIFVFVAKVDATSGLERYEMWPRPIDASYVYPYTYITRTPSLTDEAPALPPAIARRGDVLIEMALTNLALWPGTANQPNPYRDPGASAMHRKTAEHLIYEMEKKDDDIATTDLIYSGLPFMGPWSDGSWLQTHAIYQG